MKKPILIKAGDPRVKLGHNSTPPKVDCRVVAEDLYKTLYTEEECRNMVFNYAHYLMLCISNAGAEEASCVGMWFEKNKKQ